MKAAALIVLCAFACGVVAPPPAPKIQYWIHVWIDDPVASHYKVKQVITATDYPVPAGLQEAGGSNADFVPVFTTIGCSNEIESIGGQAADFGTGYTFKYFALDKMPNFINTPTVDDLATLPWDQTFVENGMHYLFWLRPDFAT